MSTRGEANPLFLREDELLRGFQLLQEGYFVCLETLEKELKRIGLSVVHFRTLHTVSKTPGLAISDGIEKLHLSKQSFFRAFNHLKDQGLVYEQQDTHDRRIKRIYPTHEGEKLDDELWQPVRALLSQTYRQAGADSVMGFNTVLEGMQAKGGRHILATR